MNTHRRTLMNHLFENMNALKRGMAGHMQTLYRDCPIPRSQLELLFAIHYHQPVSFKQLAQLLYLTPGAVSQLAEGLEEHKLITRHADADDRRIQCLSVAKPGEELLQKVEKHRQGLMETVVQDLSDEELTVWLRVQEKLLQHFQTEFGTSDTHSNQPKSND